MACEDYPCCGHPAGDCPRVDARGTTYWPCVECGRRLSRSAPSSICATCQSRARRRAARGDDPYGDHDHSMDY